MGDCERAERTKQPPSPEAGGLPRFARNVRDCGRRSSGKFGDSHQMARNKRRVLFGGCPQFPRALDSRLHGNDRSCAGGLPRFTRNVRDCGRKLRFLKWGGSRACAQTCSKRMVRGEVRQILRNRKEGPDAKGCLCPCLHRQRSGAWALWNQRSSQIRSLH